MTDWPNNPAFRLSNGDISRQDYQPGYATRVSRSNGLVTLDQVVAERRTELRFTEQSTASGAFVDIFTWGTYVPPYALNGRMFYKGFGRVDAGSSAEYRLRNDTNGVDGGAVLFTTPNSDDILTFACQLVMPAVQNPIVPYTFKIQARITGGGGSVFFTGTDHLGLWFEGD